MVEAYIPLVNEINRYDVPKNTHYNFFYSTLPKKKHFFKYIKKSKEIDLEDKKCIAKYFEIGLRETEEYIKILEPDQIQKIIDVFKFGRQ
jgi:hypothetical protein